MVSKLEGDVLGDQKRLRAGRLPWKLAGHWKCLSKSWTAMCRGYYIADPGLSKWGWNGWASKHPSQ